MVYIATLLQRGSKRWHYDIDNQVQGYELKDFNSSRQPWLRMRQATDRYLAKKKGPKSIKRCDELLKKLVLEHEQKHIAIVACGHAFSPAALEDLLVPGTLAHVGSPGGLIIYLQCVHAVSLVSDVVSKDEGVEALKFLKVEDIASSAHLEELVDSLTNASNRSFGRIRMNAVPMQLESLNQQLKDFKTNLSWSGAYIASSWLSKLDHTSSDMPEDLQHFKDLLVRIIPSWYAWACWQPNIERIATWKKLSFKTRQDLSRILDLDGPDFGLSDQTPDETPSMPQRVRDNDESHIIDSTCDEYQDLSERLLCLLETIVTRRPEDRALFMCMISGSFVSKPKLKLMELLMRDTFATISIKIAEAYSLRGSKSDVQMAAVQWLLKHFNTNGGDDLRNLFAIDFAALMTQLIRDKRKSLLEIFKATIEDDFTTTDFDQYHTLYMDLLQASWLWPLLEESLPGFLDYWPSTEDLMTLRSIYHALKSASIDTQICLRDLIESYILENAGTLNQRPRDLIASLIHFWKSCQDWTRRRIVLLRVGRAGYLSSPPCWWLEQLPTLSESFVQSFNFIACDYEEHPNRACIAMADLLATASLCVDMSHWRPVLHRMIVDQGDELLEYALDELSLHGWVIFLQNIYYLYGDFPNWHPSRCPAVLKPGLLEWNKKLLPYASIIDSLRERPNSSDAIRCICYSAVYGIKPATTREPIRQIIKLLSPRRAPNADEDDSAVRVSILNRLSKYKTSAPEVHKSLLCLNDLSPTGLEICIRTQHLLDTEPSSYVARTFLEAWLSEPTLNRHDLRILKDFFKFESTSKESSTSWLEDKGLALAADYLDSEYAELLNEARRLAAMRACLKTIDLQGVTELLASIEIEDSPAVDDVLSSLSPEIVNAVEIVGEKEVEILFPLTDLTMLQRTALGLGTVQSFVLLLELCDHKTTNGRFCIHLGAESKYLVDTYPGQLLMDIDNGTSPWRSTCRLGTTRGMRNPPCCSLDASPFKRNFTIMLQRHLQASNLGRDLTSLSELHSFITHHLKNIGRYCTECGQEFSTNLRKPTTCNSTSCTSSFLTTNPAIRLSDIIRDPLAADLLIASIYYAASSKNLALIPNSPFQDTTKIMFLLNQLPSTLTLSKQLSRHSSHNIEINTQSLQLLTYIITHPRSYLLTATNNLKIPSLPPGTLQFLLASTPPERETLFLSHLSPPPKPTPKNHPSHNPIHLHPSKIIPFYDSESDSDDDIWKDKTGEARETRILFHGTNPDRLWPILCQGLKNLSNTPLQSHGAISGQGIYLADEPSTSFRYCTNSLSIGWRNSEIFGKGEGKAYKVLLGVEHAGKKDLTWGENIIHVVREEGSLVVRYLFLIPDDAERVPVGRHLRPAMGSVGKGIRGGVL